MSSVDARINDIFHFFKSEKRIIENIMKTQPNPSTIKDITYEEDLFTLRTIYKSGNCISSNRDFIDCFLLALKIILFDSSDELDYKMWAEKFDTYMMENPKILECFQEKTDWNNVDAT